MLCNGETKTCAIWSGNDTDHQVAALDDLATTNRGHRHSGASVGYLSFVFRDRSVSAPDRTVILQASICGESSVWLNAMLVRSEVSELGRHRAAESANV